MIITVVTYQRPKMAAEIYRHLVEEMRQCQAHFPCRAIIFDNGGSELVNQLIEAGEKFQLVPPDRHEDLRGLVLRHFQPEPFIEIWSCAENVGAGVARNMMLRERAQGESFVRMDDDWLPGEHGWLNVLDARTPTANMVRLAPTDSIEPGRAGLAKGQSRYRLPDTCGPIWCVGGRTADDLGFFDTRFGPTLFDDLEFSRRVVEYRRRRRDPRGVLEIGWPHRNLEELGGRGPSRWNPDWDLFKQHCEALKELQLYVPFEQPEPGWFWGENGKTFKETK